MDINSIVNNIKYGISSEKEGRINITEKSFLMDLLDDKSASLKGFKPHMPKIDKIKRFPVSNFILKFMLFVIEEIIWGFYWVIRCIRLLFLGKKQDKDLSTSPRLNFVIFISAIITYLVIVILLLAFFVKSVLLFYPNSGVNDKGAFTVPQDCARENYIFLFNTATCWANTGIKVLEGDEVIISASGSFFGSIDEMKKSAESNEKPKYTRNLIVHYNQENKKDTVDTTPLCMYHAKDARFGSLLVQIKEDGEELLYRCSTSDNDTIKQIDFKDFDNPPHIPIKKSGVLYFAVNDISLTDSVVFDSIKNSTAYKKYLNFKTIKDKRKDKIYTIDKDSINYKEFCEIIPQDFWFSDNVGEILLNITVVRDDFGHDSFVPTIVPKTYRWIEMKINKSTWRDYVLWFVVITLLLLGDYSTGVYLRKRLKHGK